MNRLENSAIAIHEYQILISFESFACVLIPQGVTVSKYFTFRTGH